MIVLDTSALIASLSGQRDAAAPLRALVESGERIVLPTIALYEWLRGPRTEAELEVQEALFPATEAVAFGPDEATAAAALYRSIPRPRGREIDLAIAATALVRDAAVWTLNAADFRDIPGLRLV